MLKPVTAAILFAAAGLGSAGMARADSLTGTTVLATNTFQGEQTGNAEVDVSAFGMPNNLFATVGDAVEFPGFITIYDVDIGAGTIGFKWIDSEFSRTITGPTPAGNHDRNYFTFSLPAGKAITAIAFDAGASKLLAGSAEPTAAIVAPNKVVTDFSEGVVRGLGFEPVFTVTVGDAPATK